MPRPVAAKPTPLSARPAAFVTGSIMRHVVVMATTGAVGLVAVFAVDLLNLFYLSRLGTKPVAAAIGFAGTIGFFQNLDQHRHDDRHRGRGLGRDRGRRHGPGAPDRDP